MVKHLPHGGMFFSAQHISVEGVREIRTGWRNIPDFLLFEQSGRSQTLPRVIHIIGQRAELPSIEAHAQRAGGCFL